MKSILILEDDPINFCVSLKTFTKRTELNVKRTENVEEMIKNSQRERSLYDFNECFPILMVFTSLKDKR